jgi:hypothetical protein
LAKVEQDGFVRFHELGALRDHLAANFHGHFRCIYTPLSGDGLQHFEGVNRMVRFCGRMVYAVDEVDKFQEPSYSPPELYELCNYCRHREVAMIGTARRPAQVSKDYTYGLSEICAFGFTEPGDLKYFEGKCGSAVAGVIPSLGKFEYIRWIQGRPDYMWARGW